jgi:hypothetical protein
LESILPDLEDEEEPFVSFLSFLPFNKKTALASCGGLKFLDDTLTEELGLQRKFRIFFFASW